jgi:uncharacterized protein
MDGLRLAPPTAMEESAGRFCRFDGRRLFYPDETGTPSPLTHYVHDAFRAHVLNDRFSCIAGRSAVQRSAYGFALYSRMDGVAEAENLGLGLSRFLEDADLAQMPLTAFVASFVDPVPATEACFEDLLWSLLQRLHGADARHWAAESSELPESPNFAFSFGATAFFVVGLHAGSCRLTRRFAWPTLVFNPHWQFEQLRDEGRYTRFRDVIRARELTLQGTLNPMLSDFGERSEARQYSGRAVDEEWRCPFAANHHRAAESED